MATRDTKRQAGGFLAFWDRLSAGSRGTLPTRSAGALDAVDTWRTTSELSQCRDLQIGDEDSIGKMCALTWLICCFLVVCSA